MCWPDLNKEFEKYGLNFMYETDNDTLHSIMGPCSLQMLN